MAKDKKQTAEHNADRRQFLRKAAYSAPALVLLGGLSASRKADAQSCTPWPSCATDPGFSGVGNFRDAPPGGSVGEEIS